MMVEDYLQKLPFFAETKTSELGGRVLQTVREKLLDLGKNRG